MGETKIKYKNSKFTILYCYDGFLFISGINIFKNCVCFSSIWL